MKRALFLTMAIVLLLGFMVYTPIVAAAENDPIVSRFVVVSDIHTSPISTKTTIDRLPKVFETAYAYAKAQGGTIDAFVFNGDSINGNEDKSGYIAEDEWKLFLAGVRDNVKEESKVLLTLARTHDIYDGNGNNFYVEGTEINTLIKEYLGDNGSIIPTADWGYDPHLTEINGVPIITLSNDMDNGALEGTDDDDNADNSYHNSEDWLDTQLNTLVEANPNRPIFVIFHYPEVGKLGWTQRWGQNSLRDTLNKYPQVIAMNAHVHWDPRLSDGITQDQFTEVYDGAIRDIVGPDATTIGSGKSPITSYSIVEVTQSGAVTIKYIDPETGEFLKEANGSGDVLTYSIPKAWDKSTWSYTDEAKFAVEKAAFATNASIKLENSTLTFDRAASEHPIIRYRVDVDNGTATTTKYVFSDLYKAELPTNYSTNLTLDNSVENTITVTAIDGIYRESANTLTVTCAAGATGTITGNATEVIQKTYGGNGEEDEHNYPYFKNYYTTEGAVSITDWAISDMDDLKAWSEFSKSNTCEGLTFHLVNDIDMKDEIFNMIGSIYVPFKGNFDGHLHTVSNLFIDDTSGMGTGFFVKTDGANISNFGIENGLVRGHISNRKYENTNYVAGTTKRTTFLDVIGVGSIVGRADNTTFTHVWNGADVTYRDDHMEGISNPCFGGLVGRAQSACTFVGCYNTGDVHGLDRASGITNWAQSGTNAARIINCFNLGQITCETNKQTEAIGRYNSVNTDDNSYFNYNNYYLEGSATVAGNRDSSTGYINGAVEPVSLTAEQIRSELANKLNAYNDINGEYADTALWKTDEETGVPYIASLDGSDTGEDTGGNTGEDTDGNTGGGTGEGTGGNAGEDTGGGTENPGYYSINDFAAYKDTATTFSVASADDMVALAALSKENTLEGYTIIMTDDIDMSSVTDFAGIGAEKDYHFKGTFDGQNHTISKLTLTDVKNMGLFIRINNGTVQNLTLSDVNITTSDAYCGVLAYWLTGVVNIHNVHIKDSSITAGANYNAGFAAYVDKGESYSYTLSYCTVDNLTIDGLTNKKQQSAVFVAGVADNTTIDHCMVTNSTISGQRNIGIISAAGVRNTMVTNFISYGNTLKCNYNSVGLVANTLGSDREATLKNCIFYTTDGAQNMSGNDSTTSTNCTTFTLFGNPSEAGKVTTENIYMTQNNEVALKDFVIATTEDELNSGAIAYALGWSMKDGKICYADDNHKATVKYTYNYGETTEYRYTDYTGAIIGEEITAPDGYSWNEAAGEKEGDKIFTATSTSTE